MFISGYTPSRLKIWRNYSNSGFPVSQQPALKPITVQGVLCNAPLFDVINNNIFALSNVNSSNPILVSRNNGFNFAESPNLPVAQVWRGITGSPTRLIMTGGTNTSDIAFSDNQGSSWNNQLALPPGDWGQCAYGNNRLVIVNTITSGCAVSTDNGVSYSVESSNTSGGGIKFLNGFFYRFGPFFTERSATGLTGSWTICKLEGNLNFNVNNRNCFVYALSRWICASGNMILVSSDGLNFKSILLPITYTPTAIVYANNNFIFLSANVSNIVITSADLIWFTQRTNYDSSAMLDAAVSSLGVALLRDSASNIRSPDTEAYEVSYV